MQSCTPVNSFITVIEIKWISNPLWSFVGDSINIAGLWIWTLYIKGFLHHFLWNIEILSLNMHLSVGIRLWKKLVHMYIWTLVFSNFPTCDCSSVTDIHRGWGLISDFRSFTAHSSTFCSALVTLDLVTALIQLLPYSQGINTMVCISWGQALIHFSPRSRSSSRTSVSRSGPQGPGKYRSQEEGTLRAAGPSWIATWPLCYSENGRQRDGGPQYGCLVHAGH